MSILVIGATGKTGRLVAQDLLNKNCSVKIIKREKTSLPPNLKYYENLTIINGTILEMTDSKLEQILLECDTVIFCLGHNLDCKGLFGQPKKLVTNTLERVSSAIKKIASNKMFKLVLMNSVGVKNLDLNEKKYFSYECLNFFLRKLLPPHLDNEQAAEHLRVKIGQDCKTIEWVSIRPVRLINDDMSVYNISFYPKENPFFEKSKVSRSNVAHFIIELISNKELWNKYKGCMPVIYNKETV